MYCIDPNSDEPILLINSHIGFDSEDGMGIDGAAFQRELMELDGMGKKRIQVWINSPGGVVMDGYNIASAILKSKTPVDTYNVGIAASIAGVIFMTGRKRVMADYGLLMIHPPANGDSKVLTAMADSLTTLLTAKSSISKESVKYLMDRTTWLTCSECFEKGFCTEIENTNTSNKKYAPSGEKAVWEYATNKIEAFKTTNLKPTDMSITKITMKLGLNDAATEDNVVAAIKGIEDKAYQAEVDKIAAENKLAAVENAAKAEKAAMQKQLDEMSAKLAEDKAAFDKMKAEFDAIQADKIKAENAAKEVAAKNMVEGYAKTGRIKNEAAVILKWTNLAVNDFEGTEEILKEIPLSKAAVVIPTQNKLGEGELPTNAMALAVKNKLKREGKL